MNRIEALNVLGLDSNATDEDIKTAYRECAQILHPDKFANNKKLQDRASEQFKRLQDAYNYLTSGRGSKGASAPRSRTGSSRSAGRSGSSQYEAQMAGLTAARTQLVAQRDALLDERRNAGIMLVVGAAVAFFARRIVWLAGLGSAAAVWGIISLVSAHQNLSSLDEHIEQIDKQKRQLKKRWEEQA